MEAQQDPVPYEEQMLLLSDDSLKGIAPMMFDGNRHNTEQFTHKFMLYRMINQDMPTMKNAYIQAALALSFIRGPAINNWVLQQTNKLYLNCNGNMPNRVVPTYYTNDESLWVAFEQDFQRAFTDTTLEQRAHGELTNFTMENKSVNEYVTQFKHLLQRAGWDCTACGSLFQFKRGLNQGIHLKILQREPMPTKTLDNWEEAAQKEVECQAFIDASLRPRNFYKNWNGRKEEC